MAGRFALIVASGAYSDPKLSRLRTPTTDAESLARVLRDPEIGDFEVDLAVDEPESALRRRIAAFFSERSRDDLLLLHFSCHGLKDDSGHLYFAATDTEVAQLDATAVSAEFVSRQMTRSRSRKVITLLDCCYSGAIARGLTFRGGDRVDLDDHLGGSGRVILTASSAMEYAFEGEELTGTGNPSVFTTAVVKGLETGEADRDQDHRISVEELYDYVCEQVREVTPDQSPNMLSHLEGELYLARSSYVAPVEAAQLPPELRAAIDSPLAGVREGVVSELARLLAGHDPAVAAAARDALGHLAADDSRRVGAAAAAALAAGGAAPAVHAPSPAVRRPAPSAPTEPAPATPAGTARGRLLRWGPLGLSVTGALVVLATLAVFDADASDGPLRHAELVTGLAMVAALAIPVLRVLGTGWSALDAIEPVLAGIPLGLAAASGGLQEAIGFYFSPRALAVGGALLLGSVLWRRRRQASRPGWAIMAIVAAGSVLVFISPSAQWWDATIGPDLMQSPLTDGLPVAAVVAVLAVAVARWRGGGAWAVLVAAAGATALFAALAIRDYTGIQGYDSNSGLVLALFGGLVVTAAGVYAQLIARR